MQNRTCIESFYGCQTYSLVKDGMIFLYHLKLLLSKAWTIVDFPNSKYQIYLMHLPDIKREEKTPSFHCHYYKNLYLISSKNITPIQTEPILHHMHNTMHISKSTVLHLLVLIRLGCSVDCKSPKNLVLVLIHPELAFKIMLILKLLFIYCVVIDCLLLFLFTSVI